MQDTSELLWDPRECCYVTGCISGKWDVSCVASKGRNEGDALMENRNSYSRQLLSLVEVIVVGASQR